VQEHRVSTFGWSALALVWDFDIGDEKSWDSESEVGKRNRLGFWVRSHPLYGQKIGLVASLWSVSLAHSQTSFQTPLKMSSSKKNIDMLSGICSSLPLWPLLFTMFCRLENRLCRKCRHIFETPLLYHQLSPVQLRDMLVYLTLYRYTLVSLFFHTKWHRFTKSKKLLFFYFQTVGLPARGKTYIAQKGWCLQNPLPHSMKPLVNGGFFFDSFLVQFVL